MFSLILVAVAAPVVVYGAGYLFGGFAPFARDEYRSSLVPLLGCCCAGVLGELTLFTGMSWYQVWWGLALVGLLRMMRCGGYEGLREFVLAYLLLLMLCSLSRYPGIFRWGGDWLESVETVRHLLGGTQSLGMKCRTPFFQSLALQFVV